MDGINYLGLLKVDFLGLVTLTIMSKACEYIAQRHGVNSPSALFPSMTPGLQFISEGHTVGLFQLEGSGMTRYLMQMKPETIHHVVPWSPFLDQVRGNILNISPTCTVKSR